MNTLRVFDLPAGTTAEEFITDSVQACKLFGLTLAETQAYLEFGDIAPYWEYEAVGLFITGALKRLHRDFPNGPDHDDETRDCLSLALYGRTEDNEDA